MIIECSYCEAKVNAQVVGKHAEYDPDNDPSPFTTYLLERPNCKNGLLAGEYDHNDGAPSRLWPRPPETTSWSVPEIIRDSIDEARRCFNGAAYSACAVMCGRALEALCRHYKTKSKYMGGGLRELKDQGIIDARLLKWAEELQKARNSSAHATGEKITKADAQDLLDFAAAICEYVFVLTEKFEKFMKRKQPKPATGGKP